MSYSFELEIRRLLGSSDPFEEVTSQILQKITEAEFADSEENLNSLYQFLIRSQQPQLLIEFVRTRLKDTQFKIPWGHFLECIALVYEDIDPKLISLIKKGLKETEGKYEACRSQKWDHLIADMVHWRSQKRWEFSKIGPLRKKELLDELYFHRAQQLFESEKKLLKLLEKMFPGDNGIQRELSETKERSAFEILGKYRTQPTVIPTMAENEEKQILEVISQAMLKTCKDHPEIGLDLAIAGLMFDDAESSYQILLHSPESQSKIWLKTELQLKTKRYLDLLNDLIQIEVGLASNPETFFATAFLRAQALWGLGQKHMAMEVLEGLLASRPHYRSAAALLNLWRTR